MIFHGKKVNINLIYHPQKKKAIKKKKKHRRKFIPTPDGSPAKFYCDAAYSRLFHRLAARDGHMMPMDATFVRNGQLELVYLTAGQMRAVREFCWGSEKYYLVKRSCQRSQLILLSFFLAPKIFIS